MRIYVRGKEARIIDSSIWVKTIKQKGPGPIYTPKQTPRRIYLGHLQRQDLLLLDKGALHQLWWVRDEGEEVNDGHGDFIFMYIQIVYIYDEPPHTVIYIHTNAPAPRPWAPPRGRLGGPGPTPRWSRPSPVDLIVGCLVSKGSVLGFSWWFIKA